MNDVERKPRPSRGTCNCNHCHLLAVAKGDLTAWLKRHAHIRPESLRANQRRDFELLAAKVANAADQPCLEVPQ